MVKIIFDITDIGDMVNRAKNAYDDAAQEARDKPSQAAYTKAANALRALHKTEDMASALVKMLSQDVQ